MTAAHLSQNDGALLDVRIDELWPVYQTTLCELVRLPSLAGNETAAQQLLADRARAAGLEVDLWQVDPHRLAQHPDFATADHSLRPRPNLTAVLPGTGGGRSIAVSGHVDVVPTGPVDQWDVDPWGGRVVGDRLYGRGALDMKGGLIAGLLAIEAIRMAGLARRGDVVFESVIEEESTGNGTLAARQRAAHGSAPQVDAALIPEVSGEDVQIANPGVLWFEVTVRGRAAYVGLAGASVNAIEVASELIARLQALPHRWNAVFEHEAYRDFPEPLTLNVGTIRGGDWPSNVPLSCVVGFRLAFPLQWSVQRAKDEVQQHIDRWAEGHPWLRHCPPAVRWHGFQAAGFAIDPDQPIVALLRANVAAVTGEPARISPMFGTADARYFADRNIPAVYYGPAGGGMHAPDEWVGLASVRRVARVLAGTIAGWIG